MVCVFWEVREQGEAAQRGKGEATQRIRKRGRIGKQKVKQKMALGSDGNRV